MNRKNHNFIITIIIKIFIYHLNHDNIVISFQLNELILKN